MVYDRIDDVSKQTLILIIFLTLFTAGLLILALNKSSYQPKIAYKLPIPSITVKKSVADTLLLFGDLEVVPSSTASGTVQPKFDKYLLPILVKTGTNKITAVQLEMAFDPNVLTNIDIKPSNFLEGPIILINEINSRSGRISYALGIAPSASESGKQGEGTLATLTFQTKNKLTKLSVGKTASESAATGSGSLTSSNVVKTQALKQTGIVFLSKTFVTAEGLQQSALKSTNSAQLKFGN